MPDPTQLRNPNNHTRPNGVKPLTQDGRTAMLKTPLGKDVLALVSFDMSEALSDLFEINVEAISEDRDINFDRAIGQECTVRIRSFTEGIIQDRPEDPRYRNAQPTEDRRKKPLQEQQDARRGEGEDRFYSGILVAAQCTGPSQVDYTGYRLTLRPWLYLLSKTTDCRIFENKTAPQIIKEVFSDRGFTDFDSKLTDEGSYPKLEYCVQYHETDFNLVCRVMEKEGIYYYFKHEDGKHTLVLADSKSSHEPVPRHATIPFIPPSGNWVNPGQRIEEWTNAPVQDRQGRVQRLQL
jgi:type VI secretion system secreted protein VgrG